MASDHSDITEDVGKTSPMSSCINIETATSPVVAANQIFLTTANSSNPKIVGVLVEEHHHYGTTEDIDNNERKQKSESIFQLDRNALTKLVSKYKEEEGWMYPLPWEHSLKLEPEEFYVDLTLDAYSKSGLYSKGVKAIVEDIFDPLLPGGLPVQRVLIQGNAGFGKSSLCQKAVYDWSHGITTFRALPWQSSLPVLFKLRFLDEDSNLESLILKFIAVHYSTQGGDQELKSFIQSLGRNLLIILDGYDELEPGRQRHAQSVLESWKHENSLLRSASLLVTTRPSSDTEFLLTFEKHYFVTSISEENVELLVQKFNSFTCTLTERYAHKTDKLLANLSRSPKTRLLEKCLARQTGKKVRLKEMPPLMIALICWVVSQSRTNFRSNDVIYRCLELLSKRCNEREKFGFTDETVDEIMFKFGLVCFKTGTTVMAESLLRKELGSKFSFLVLTGILKCSQDHRGITVWEPVHKSFIDALVERILACDGIKSLNRNDVREFLHGDITSINCEVVLHATQVDSICFSRLLFRYNICVGLKHACLKWTHGSNLRPLNPQYIQVERPGNIIKRFKYSDNSYLQVFAKKFPTLLCSVQNNKNVQNYLNLHSKKPYVFSCDPNHSTEDTLIVVVYGINYDFLKLMTYRTRDASLSRYINVNSQSTSLEDVAIGKPQTPKNLAGFFSFAKIPENDCEKSFLDKKLSLAFMSLFHIFHMRYSREKLDE